MNQIIPVHPCGDADALIEFYSHLGFEMIGRYVRSYIVMKYKELEFHFYGTKQVRPEENSCMCIIRTDDLEQLYNDFTMGLKASTGKIPRSGFPKITKIRDLSEDRRFTLTDPSGNTFYILTPKPPESHTFFRELDNAQYAKKFAVLYDLLYSKGDYKIANAVLVKLLAAKEHLGDLDKAKLLLAKLDIHKGLGFPADDAALKLLISANPSNVSWNRIEEKLAEIFRQE